MTATAVLAVVACSRSEPPGAVSKAAFEAGGKAWPLTVDSGVVGCTGLAYWFENGGKRYALNGIAQGQFEPIEPIWRWDEKLLAEVKAAAPAEERDEVLPVRISIGPLIDAADEACPGD